MLPRMWSQLPCMNMAVNQLIPQGSGAWQRAVDRARVERRVVDGRVQVRELVEDPDREVGGDQRDVDDREAPGAQAVGEREHRDCPSS